ncbi:MAG: biopolymer transporter ExbD [Bacteroidaceae bacterium]|nr:biopolymer transporter ExbD [Bacteroidaceae bacterium]
MAGFKKGSREMPEMNTSSLPDLIFTILFFFMIVTTMREVTLMVKITTPQGTELEKLEKKSAVSFIYMGPPTDQYRAKYGSKPRMQLNNKYADPSEIKDFIAQERQSMEDQTAQVISMKIDRDTKMSLLNSVKAQLRQSWALKINYSAGSRGAAAGKGE